MMRIVKRFAGACIIVLLSFFGIIHSASAQKPVAIADSVDQHIFSWDEIEYLSDPNGELQFEQVSSNAFNRSFKPSNTSTPQTLDIHSTYWFRIRIKHNKDAEKRYLLEFFDQTIDDVSFYIPDDKGFYTEKKIGDNYPFKSRTFNHKNFELHLANTGNTTKTYYFKLKSSQSADVIVVLRSIERFIHYSLDEYFIFGIFYGMILVFSLYNFLMFLAMKQRQYLDYVLFVLSVGIYQMCVDGVAYQYLWPDSPEWNRYAFGVALYFVSLFSLFFVRDLLYVKAKAPFFYKLINAMIAFRTILFLYTLLFNREWFNYKFIEFIPLLISFATGIYILRRGYSPARFFVLGYGVLFLGFILKLLIVLSDGSLNFGVISYYSLSICFILQMVFLSFAVGDRVAILKVKKEKAQRRIIQHMKENERLKDVLNLELEQKVKSRTKEVIEKSAIIATQNEELTAANTLLKQQAEEISRINALLAQDNIELQTNIEKVTRARIMSTEVDFEEFSKIYPDEGTCYKFLADLKWEKGFECSKCGHTSYFQGHSTFNRRCSKCSYEESVTTNTIFHNSRIPITKAFYMVFLVYSTKGKISSHRLSELLGIRQSTCWARLADPPGASSYLVGGVVAYSNESKIELLGVPAELIDSHGAVSPEVAEAMADGASERFDANLAVGITGIAGPGGGTKDKPVGYVCICVKVPGGPVLARDPVIPGDRHDVRDRACTLALHLIRRILRGEGSGTVA